MIEFTAFLVAVGPLAIGITKLVDFVRDFDKGDTWPKNLWIALAMALGVGAALLGGINFAGLITGLSPQVASKLSGTLGQIVTGLAIGGTASVWHTQLAALSAKYSNS